MNKSISGIGQISFEESLKVVFESNPIPHLILAPDSPHYTIIAANEAYTKATYTKAEEITGKALFDIFPPQLFGDDGKPGDQLLESLKKVIQTKKPNQIELHEYELPNKPGSIKPEPQFWNLVNIPVISTTGEVAFIIHTVVDVTDKMLHQRSVQQQKENDIHQRDIMFNLFKQAPVAIALISGADFKIEIANPACCKLWGKKEEQVVGLPLFEALQGSAGQGFEELLQNVRRTGIPYIGVEVPSKVERDGKEEIVYFNFIYHPLRERDGSFNRIVVISTEVIEQAAAKTDLERSREHLKLALDFANIGVWEYDYFAKHTTYSEIANKLFGYTEPLEWNQKLFLEHVIEEDKEYVKERVQVIREKGVLDIDFRVRRPDGNIRWLSMQGKTLYDSRHKPVRMLGLLSDITDRKNAEKQKDEFMGVVSHELKTPVTSLKAYGQILHSKFLEQGDQQSASFLAKMDNQVNKLTSLIGDLLEATRIENGQLRFNEEVFNSSDMINEVIEEVQRTTNTHKIIRSNYDNCSLYGDRERVGQVLTNLLTNAIKYSPGQSEVIVSTSVTGKEFRCCVSDKGLGIPTENRTKVFDRYFRVYGEKRRTFPGLGLGLYISSEIIKRQNGNIWVESEEGKGSTFCFSLPIAECHD